MNSEILAFTLVTCVEGGSTHWVNELEAGPKLKTERFERPWYSDPAIFEARGFGIVLTDCEGDKHELSAESFIDGWEKFARVYPKRAERVAELDGQADAEDADIFLQIATFGNLVYG